MCIAATAAAAAAAAAVGMLLQGIIANGMGYESNGSVYFDTAKFRWAPLQNNPSLVPLHYPLA
jgi:cysteinyl-tRNA synthetase